MVRTHVIACKLARARADALNLESGRVYTGVLVAHWRTVRKKNLWLSEGSAKRWSDTRTNARMHAHTIDAAQEGFYTACETTRGLRKAGFTEAKFPHWTKKFRTTIWKNTAIKRHDDVLELSCGGRTKKEREERKISFPIPTALRDCLRFLEVRLVYDKKARRYFWHIVVENGKQPKPSPGGNVVAVDLGEIHPAVVGDEAVATVITCRERRAESQGHAKRLAKIQQAASRKQKGSRSHRRLMKAKSRMKAKHGRVMRDMEHKISRTIVDTAVERKAGTIAIGDIRDIADGVDCGTVQNGRMSRWNHGKISDYVEYKAAAEGIVVALVDEHHTSQTCPNCEHRHKPRGRKYGCPVCGFQAHRDVVGQVNILSVFRHGEPGKIAAPSLVKYRIPHDMRVMRRCQDTGQERMPVARGLLREAVGLWPRQSVTPTPPVHASLRVGVLDPGEMAVLSVALNHPGWEAVLDDHSARREATRLGIPCIGTVGLVLTGHRLGIVPSVPDALQTLREAGMYISDGLFRPALDQAGE